MRIQVTVHRFQARPVEPKGGRRFVVGDLHGCYKTLRRLLSELKFGRNDVLYLLGDYVDNGPRIRQLLDFIMRMQQARLFVPLRGNHEQYMIDAYTKPALNEAWWVTKKGGAETLDSFGVDSVREIPEPYIRWLKRLPYVVRVPAEGKTFVLSHAGVDPHAKKPFANTPKNREYVLRNRDTHKAHDEIVNVVGHSVRDLIQIRKSLKSHKIFLDGGCAYGKHLVALNLDTLEITAVKKAD